MALSLAWSYSSISHSIFCMIHFTNSWYTVCLAFIWTAMAMKNDTKNRTPHESVVISSDVRSALFRWGPNLEIWPLSDRKHMTVAMAQPIIMTKLTRNTTCRILS